MKNYYDGSAILFNEYSRKTENFMYNLNAQFIKESHLGEKNKFLLGKEVFDKTNSLIYTVDTFFDLKENKSSNNIVLNKKNANNIFDYVEVIKSGLLLLCYLENFDVDDITLKVNLNNKNFEKEFEKLKSILLSLGMNFEIDESLQLNSENDFNYSYVYENKNLGIGEKINDEIYFSIDIDELLTLKENEVVLPNEPGLYIITNSEEEKIYGFKILDELRSNGYSSAMFNDNISVKEQLDIAKSSFCGWIVTVEDENLKKGLVKVTNTLEDTEEYVDINEILEYVSEIF